MGIQRLKNCLSIDDSIYQLSAGLAMKCLCLFELEDEVKARAATLVQPRLKIQYTVLVTMFMQWLPASYSSDRSFPSAQNYMSAVETPPPVIEEVLVSVAGARKVASQTVRSSPSSFSESTPSSGPRRGIFRSWTSWI